MQILQYYAEFLCNNIDNTFSLEETEQLYITRSENNLQTLRIFFFSTEKVSRENVKCSLQQLETGCITWW